jgi:hypothetical protein
MPKHCLQSDHLPGNGARKSVLNEPFAKRIPCLVFGLFACSTILSTTACSRSIKGTIDLDCKFTKIDDYGSNKDPDAGGMRGFALRVNASDETIDYKDSSGYFVSSIPFEFDGKDAKFPASWMHIYDSTSSYLDMSSLKLLVMARRRTVFTRVDQDSVREFTGQCARK